MPLNGEAWQGQIVRIYGAEDFGNANSDKFTIFCPHRIR